MVNRFFRRTPYDIGLYVPPVDVIRETMQFAQKQYDTNYALSETIKNNFVNSLPQDRQRANEIQKKWESQVDEIVNTAGQDYSKIGKQLGRLMSDIRREYNPGGEANAITSNFNNYSTWLKEHQDRVAKGNVLGEDLNLANSYYMRNYQGIGKIDPVTGSYNRFNPDSLADWEDPNKTIQDTYKEFKPEKRKVGTSWIANDGTIRYSEVEQEGITPQRLQPSFETALAANPKYMSYISQRAKFLGNSDAVQPFIKSYTTQRANDLSYMNQSQIDKLERDPIAVARAKAQMDRENIDYYNSLQQYGESTTGLLSMEPTFDPNNWRADIGNSSITPASAGTLGSALLSAPYSAEYKRSMAEQGESLQSFLSGKNDAKIQSKWNISPALMRAVWDQKKSWTPEFATKYGKDPKWTKEFESNFMWDVSKEAKNHSAYQTVEDEIPEPARDQNLLRALRGAISGQWPTYQVGSTVSKAGLPEGLKDLLYDEKEGKFKNLDVLDVTYVRPGPGVATAGYKIATPKGSVIVQDQNGSRKQYGERMARAFNPIYFGGKDLGADVVTYDVTPDGTQYRGKPYRKFEYNPVTRSFDENLYMVEPESTVSNIKYIRDAQGNPVKRTPAEIQQIELPAYGGALGYGSSAAERTLHPFFLMNQ